jgi:hypothetical protein
MIRLFALSTVVGLFCVAGVPAFAQDRTPPDTSMKALEPPVDHTAKPGMATGTATSGGATMVGRSAESPNGMPSSKGTATGGPATGRTNQ